MHHIARIPFDQVGVFIDEGLAHAGGMGRVHAKHDGFLEPVAAGLEVVADPLGYAGGAVVDDEGVIKVFFGCRVCLASGCR